MADDTQGDEARELSAGVLRRERSAIARGLNLLEDRRPSQRLQQHALLRAIAAAPRARTVGVTGPPGAGKSTLCAALARAWIARGESVGVVAVDPSSARSGGALLGDRVRIVDGGAGARPDPKLFVRSLAAGGELGGLSRSAPACVDLLAAACDVVLIETVGVGQSEVDVASIADVTVVVVQPASGDALQFLKAGLLEIPDLVVVGKSDLGDVARRAETELRHALSVGDQVGVHGGASVALASGATGEGVDALILAIDARLLQLRSDGELTRRRRAGAIARALGAIHRRVGELGVDALGGLDAVRARVERSIDEGLRAIDAADAIVEAAVSSIRARE